MNWAIYAVLSSIFTTILYVFIAQTTKGYDGSVTATFRAFSMFLFLSPFAIYTIINSTDKNQLGFLSLERWPLLVGLAASGAASWYTFHKSFEWAPQEQQTDAAVVAVNYTSIALMVLFAFYEDRSRIDWRNWLGAVLVVSGAYLSAYRPPPP